MKNDGGSAFPFANASMGMSLRDWYAGMTLQKIYIETVPEEIAKRAYEMADAMLKARKS